MSVQENGNQKLNEIADKIVDFLKAKTNLSEKKLSFLMISILLVILIFFALFNVSFWPPHIIWQPNPFHLGTDYWKLGHKPIKPIKFQ